MPPLETLLRAIAANPGDELAWLALADALEEAGEPLRGELVRLTRRLLSMKRGARGRRTVESRIQAIILGGVRPCVPEITNSVGMRFVSVPAGTFLLGSPSGEKGRHESEPLRYVSIERPIWLGAFPVTQRQYFDIMKANPSQHIEHEKQPYVFTGADPDEPEYHETQDWPADGMSWEDACEFCRLLSAQRKEAKAGRSYRLPTEDEWEIACRAGTTTPYFFGKRLDESLANHDCVLNRPTTVGSYPPNALGLYDMHGNVWEYCAYCPLPMEFSESEEEINYALRGGSFYVNAVSCASACRMFEGELAAPDMDVGFRVVMESID
jgi:uncharacterized protein (TIGR02996 family)